MWELISFLCMADKISERMWLIPLSKGTEREMYRYSLLSNSNPKSSFSNKD